jgi:hypothetical protein
MKRRAASQERKTRLVAEEPKKKNMHPSQSSILDRSTVISSGRYWTIVPKGSVMHVPEKYEERIDAGQEGSYLDFLEFVRKNRGWVETRNVTLQQARGKAPVGESVSEGLKNSDHLVVSVFRNGPISMRPYEEPEEAASK